LAEGELFEKFINSLQIDVSEYLDSDLTEFQNNLIEDATFIFKDNIIGEIKKLGGNLKKNKEKFSTRELIEEEDSVSWNLGFILCRVCFMETWSWFIKGMPGQRIECIDLDTGEIVYKGKTRIFGYFLFKFFPFGHDYKITAETEYGRMSKKINDLDFFQKVELLFIIGH